MTASSLSSVSLRPPLISVCVDREAEMHDAILRASDFVLNVLSSHQETLARRFADLQGLANQRLAAECDVVQLCVAGLNLRLK